MSSGMEMRRDGGYPGPRITGFSGRGFRLEDTVFPGGVLLSPTEAWPWDDAPPPQALTLEALGPLATYAPTPEFLLLGTGSGLIQPPRAFVRAMEARNIGVEVMDSRAAARAWGVLRSEDRQVIAALMAL
ncbi:MAG: Mth938-like domain-containing protein [Sphingobium sp.]|nr:Mth938-like domain-containing protein [Sphingobium sp.]